MPSAAVQNWQPDTGSSRTSTRPRAATKGPRATRSVCGTKCHSAQASRREPAGPRAAAVICTSRAVWGELAGVQESRGQPQVTRRLLPGERNRSCREQRNRASQGSEPAEIRPSAHFPRRSEQLLVGCRSRREPRAGRPMFTQLTAAGRVCARRLDDQGCRSCPGGAAEGASAPDRIRKLWWGSPGWSIPCLCS